MDNQKKPVNSNVVYRDGVFPSTDTLCVSVDAYGTALFTATVMTGVTMVYLSAKDTAALAAQLTAMAPPEEVPPAAPKTPLYANLSPLSRTIYQHMSRASSVTAREAMNDYGVTSASLARRIKDIEEEGFVITRERRTHPITGHKYTRYSLAE